MLRNLCILRGSPTPSAGRKSEVATSPLPSRGPRRGRKCYVIYILGGPQRQARGQNQKWPKGGHIAYRHEFSVKLVIFSLR